MMLVAVAAVILTASGCGRPRSLFEPTPRVQREVLKYGTEEAVARAQERADSERTVQAYGDLAQTYALTKQPKLARQTLEKAVSLDPTYPRTAVLLARILLSEGKGVEAEKLARGILTKYPNQPEASETLARCLMGQGKQEQAQQVLTTALQSHGNRAELHWAQADLFAIQGRFDDSLKQYQQALKLSPQNTSLRLSYIRPLMAKGDKEQAVAEALKAVEQQPSSADVRFMAGATLQQAGRDSEALAQYKETLVLDPGMFAAANNLALLLADRQQDTSAAVTWARRAVQGAPRSLACADTFGWALARDGQYQQGLSVLRVVHKAWPDNPAVWYHLGWTLVKAGQKDEGLKLLRQTAESGRDDAAKQAQKALEELS